MPLKPIIGVMGFVLALRLPTQCQEMSSEAVPDLPRKFRRRNRCELQGTRHILSLLLPGRSNFEFRPG
jgi:hypothetical protein